MRFVVTGRVQGVGYRWFVVETAGTLGLTGWVRNRADGSVDGEAQGKAEAVAALQERLKTGHPFARVESLESQALPPQAGERGFRIER